MAWDYPFFIIATFALALGVAFALMRAAGPKHPVVGFACSVCGRKQNGTGARDWRYCPWCGVPKDAKSISAMPRGPRKSVLDL